MQITWNRVLIDLHHGSRQQNRCFFVILLLLFCYELVLSQSLFFFPPQGPLNTVSGRIHTQIEEMSRNEPVFSSLFLPLRCIFHFVYFSWVQSVVRIVGHRTWEHCLYFVHFVFPVVVRRKLQTVGRKRNPEGENTYMLKWRIKQQLSRWGKSETDKGEGIFSLNLQSARQSRTCSCWELCFVFLPPTVSHSNTYKTCEDLRLALTP